MIFLTKTRQPVKLIQKLDNGKIYYKILELPQIQIAAEEDFYDDQAGADLRNELNKLCWERYNYNQYLKNKLI